MHLHTQKDISKLIKFKSRLIILIELSPNRIVRLDYGFDWLNWFTDT